MNWFTKKSNAGVTYSDTNFMEWLAKTRTVNSTHLFWIGFITQFLCEKACKNETK
jgi:hypothetical protein